LKPGIAYPSVPYLAARAKARVPFFGWEFLESGTWLDRAADRNLTALQSVAMWPGILRGKVEPELATELFGTRYALPFGIAPVGLAGVVWPGIEAILAEAAGEARIPYGLSTFATARLEQIARLADGMGWFQLYPPADPDVRDDLLTRAKVHGYGVLVVTVDVPVASTRERQKRVGMAVPPNRDLMTVWRVAKRPAWAFALLREGVPRFWTIDPYLGGDRTDMVGRIDRIFRAAPTWDDLKAIRDLWEGPMVLKGVLRPEDAERAVALGIDGIGVSNHGGRQFDAAPAAIDCLPAVKAAVGGRAKIIFDSGLRGGLDILRALALGADFCLLGRAFHYGVGALGREGGRHVVKLLAEDVRNNMIQLGVSRLDELPGCLVERRDRTNSGP
jgi:L-lactate dehydrogenase (cytochrome)